MTMTEEQQSFVGRIIILVIVIVAFVMVFNHFTGGKLVRFLVTNILFWMPFQTLTSTYAHTIPV